MDYLVFLVAGLLAVVVFHILDVFLTPSYDLEEPPLVLPKIRLIGHLIGLLRSGTEYYSRLVQQCKQPIFTLNLPRAKMRILVTSQHGIELLSEDLLGKNGGVGLRPETLKVIYNSLMPGPDLNSMTRDTIEHLWEFLESPANLGDGKGVSLFQFIRQFFSVASTNAMYGPKNPMAIDKDFAFLGLNILPRLIAPEASRGRERFFAAFRNYYATGGLEKASHLVKERYEVNKRRGLSDNDIAQFDLGVCFALLVNSVPAMCWTLCHVYSDPNPLAALRQGIENVVFPQGHKCPGEGSTTTINVPQLIRDFPLLESLTKEVFRVQSNNASARYLREDTWINGDDGSVYLLKKDSFLVVPSAPIHSNDAIWGPTAHDSDPMRFLLQQGHKGSGSTYRTFGGGNALCPGRHLAVYEIISTLSIIVLKYDMEPLEGRWETLRTRHHISTSILTPVRDIWVRIKAREEVQEIAWKFVWEPDTIRK